MPFKSEAQRRYFYYKASQPGAEGKKWKKHLRKYRKSTPKGVKLPERVKTAAETYYHGSRYKIRKLRKGAYVTPYKEDALSFAVPWSTDDLEYAGGPDGRPPSKLKFKKRPPRDHKIYLYKVKAPVKKAKTNTGVSYDWNRVTTSAADLELVKTIPSWKKELLVKTSAQNAFEYSFFEEIDKIANELSKTEKAIYTLPALGTLAGAAFGAASPEAFHPESMFPKIVKKHGIGSARARALSAMLGAGTGATLASIPAMAYDVVQMHRPRKKKKESK